MNQIENIAHQAQNAVRTQATRAAAEVMRETSIVNASAQALGQAQNAMSAAYKKKSGVYTKSAADAHQYIEADTAYATQRSVPVFDIKSPGKPRGLRLSPVQAIRTAEGYYRRQALRITGWILFTAVIVGAIVVLLHYWGY